MKRQWKNRRPIFSSPVPKEVSSPKIKWKILPIFWLALKRLAMLLGFMMLLSMVITMFMTYRLVNKQVVHTLPEEMVLFYNFEDGFGELPSAPSFADPLAGGGETVHDFIAALDKAAMDARVKGFYARLSGARFSLAHIQEMRAAVARFKASGKFTVVYSSSYGGEGGGFGGYYLASAFDEVWMQPMGVVSIPGLSAEMPFARKLLDDLGIQPQFFQRKEFKSAYESLMREDMSDANAKAMTALINDYRLELVRDLSADRGIRVDQFEGLVDKALFTAQGALEAKLITSSDYADILVEDIKEKITGDREFDGDLFVTLGGYLNDVNRKPKAKNMIEQRMMPTKPRVAVVYAVGTIMPTAMGAGSGIAAADEIAPAIWEAAEDENVQAIILRVDSPGGSPTASESILRAVQKAQEKGKPVIVSMGPTAASGGYWIATSADQIFAMPTTLTGSIGVVGGKFSLRDMWKKIDVNWEAVQWGENASLWSMNEPFSESEAERFNAMLDQIYEGFTARVSAGRDMTPEQVETVARGRVWTGKSAKLVGLVDQIGGLYDAKDYTAGLIGVESANNVEFITLPRPKSRLQLLVDLLAEQGAVFEGLRLQGAISKAIKPFMRDVQALSGDDPALVYEPLRVR